MLDSDNFSNDITDNLEALKIGIEVVELAAKAMQFVGLVKSKEKKLVKLLDKDFRAGINCLEYINRSVSPIGLSKYINDAYTSFNRAKVSIQHGIITDEIEQVWIYLGLVYCNNAFGETENVKADLNSILNIELERRPLEKIFKQDVYAKREKELSNIKSNVRNLLKNLD